jgi:hypothetical protein
MQKMFHGKFVMVIEVQLVVETQTVIADMSVVDINVITRSKVIDEQLCSRIESQEKQKMLLIKRKKNN